MELTLKFDRAIINDEYLEWNKIQENEAVIGMLNGKKCIIQNITDEQHEHIRKQAMDAHLAKQKDI
ncbi:hypothetical protein HP567_012960 [Brevibacillus sp. M2.1A]|uniref:hypothetical protein n=1 Tax=Brevibacillus sp. M2.1A TaxID=2738980 RepID=UPI00156A9B3A|nr:hypothetical protein [Brevibacillus sp. M2.1A]MCC8435455.1 hypothetical protein [Brevibacillus sp. M2.1A]